MKGYIYKLFAGADPAAGWVYNDPIFGKPPTLGACVPNLRRLVEKGDWVFAVSGRLEEYQPYVVGGFQVKEKIDALTAYRRFPENRMHVGDSGQVLGNVIVDREGKQNSLDNHDGFERRVENYLVGGEAVHLTEPVQIERARAETLTTLGNILDRPANRLSDVLARWRRLDEKQINALRLWLTTIVE